MSAHPRPGPSLPARIQERLAALYDVDAPSVDAFLVEAASTSANDEPREVLRVRRRRGAVEMALHLPSECIRPTGALSLDRLCQAAEGVSHFLYLAERGRRELPSTQLELEIQAEVDKYLLVVGALADQPIDPARLGHVRHKLFASVRYLHPRGTPSGERYRLANAIAARFTTSLMDALQRRGMTRRLRARLKAFFDAGQREKIELALAA
ncbi:MAG: hypothetical protein U0414_38700 [Polyangiaceae bacterium]